MRLFGTPICTTTMMCWTLEGLIKTLSHDGFQNPNGGMFSSSTGTHPVRRILYQSEEQHYKGSEFTPN